MARGRVPDSPRQRRFSRGAYTAAPVAAVNSTLSSDALAALIAEHYALPCQGVSCRIWWVAANDTYLVAADSVRYCLRVYRLGRQTRDDIAAEACLLNGLHENGVRVSHPVRRKDGEFLTRVEAPEGVRYALLFTYADGDMGHIASIAQCRVYGRLAAQVHACSDKVDIPYPRFHIDFSHLVDEPLAHLRSLYAHRQSDLDYLRHVGCELRDVVSGLLPTSKPHYGMCHGDHHGGNVHVNKAGEMTLFDFDCCGYGWRSYDVAVFRWSQALQSGGTPQGKARARRRWDAFINGYSGIRELDREELTATTSFVALRHIWLMHYQTQQAHMWGYGRYRDGYLDSMVSFVRQWCENHRLL